jgi:hypothetical protein
MTHKKIIKSFLICTILSGIILSACSSQPTPEPTATQPPTADMASIQTSAVQTVYAALTETVLAQPTETSVPPTATQQLTVMPTNTPITTMTSAPTSAPVQAVQSGTYLPTWTPEITSTKESTEWRCVILSQLVADSQVMNRNEKFEAGWTVENRGTAYWSSAGLDIVYYSGTEMQTGGKRNDLPQDVPPTGNFSFSISMEAPSNPGTYQATWIFAGDPGTFCPLTVRIVVE